MSVSILLRLIPGSRADGRLAGQAHVVDTGEVATFRDVDEMVALLQRASHASAPEDSSVTTPDKSLVIPSDAAVARAGDDPMPAKPGTGRLA